MRSLFIQIVLLLNFLSLLAYSHGVMGQGHLSSKQAQAEAEVLYLPTGKALSLISLGYKNFLADVLWFKTINYFGKHYRSDQNYPWLARMCDLVTTLDPRAFHVYEFAALMLAWEANSAKESIEILNKAIANQDLKEHPNYWKFYYLRAFTYLYFLENEEKAIADFAQAARMPGAPAIAARIAAKKLTYSSKDPQSAIQFLSEILRNTKDATTRKALQKRLREIKDNLVVHNGDR